MFIHRKNALKRPSTYIIIVHIQKNHFKKINLNTKWDHNIHQDSSNCVFFKIFSRGSMPLSMSAADIIISIRKEPFVHSECNKNIH